MTEKQVFNYWRNTMGFERFPEYIDFMHDKYPELEPHHILGSTIGNKFTDALVVPLNREQHKECEPKIGTSHYNKARCFVKYLPFAVAHFICYKVYLETDKYIPPQPELMFLLNKPDFITPDFVKALIKEVQELELSKVYESNQRN